MKAPCKSICSIDRECKGINICKAWQSFKQNLETEREGRKMKCPKCHREMIRVATAPGHYYYECPNCLNAVGKVEGGSDGNKG